MRLFHRYMCNRCGTLFLGRPRAASSVGIPHSNCFGIAYDLEALKVDIAAAQAAWRLGGIEAFAAMIESARAKV